MHCVCIAMWQVREVLDSFEADAHVKLDSLQVDGGMSVNSLLMQMQADVLQAAVRRPRNVETTAMGAAFAAGLAVRVWPSVDALRDLNPVDAEFVPAISAEASQAKLARWKDAVQRTLGLGV